MSVSSVTLLWRGQTGQTSYDSKTQYTAVYRVVTTDQNDGPAVVLASSSLPILGSSYSFGNDADSGALLKNLAPRRVDGSRLYWEVQATWEVGSGEKQENQDQNGKPTSDPLRWHDELDVQTVTYQRPVENARYIGGYFGRAHAMLEDGVGPIVNSAMIPFDPPVERDDSRLTIRISKWLKEYPLGLVFKYQDTVNKNRFTIKKPWYGFSFNFVERTLKVSSISGSWQYINNISVWKITFELMFKREGWRVRVLDRGLHGRGLAGDPDALGSTIFSGNAGQYAGSLYGGGLAEGGGGGVVGVPGEPVHRHLTDKAGVPITEPVLFDGNGQPLKAFGGGAGLGVFGTWAIYDEIDFTDLRL